MDFGHYQPLIDNLRQRIRKAQGEARGLRVGILGGPGARMGGGHINPRDAK